MHAAFEFGVGDRVLCKATRAPAVVRDRLVRSRQVCVDDGVVVVWLPCDQVELLPGPPEPEKKKRKPRGPRKTIEEKRAYMRGRYEARKLAGVCTGCGGERQDETSAVCDKCRRYARTYRKAHKLECSRCGRDRSPTARTSLCRRCVDLKRKRRCACGKPTPRGRCRRCFQKAYRLVRETRRAARLAKRTCADCGKQKKHPKSLRCNPCEGLRRRNLTKRICVTCGGQKCAQAKAKLCLPCSDAGRCPTCQACPRRDGRPCGCAS